MLSFEIFAKAAGDEKLIRQIPTRTAIEVVCSGRSKPTEVSTAQFLNRAIIISRVTAESHPIVPRVGHQTSP